MARTVSARDLKSWIRDGGELAILDVREQGSYGKRHLFWASNAPLSRLELDLPRLVPRKGARIALCDGGDGLSERAAEKLSRWGYSNVSVLENGVEGWAHAGLELFSGVYVPSKAFGEFVEHEYGTPSVSADELNAMVQSGEKLVILDSRPLDEYASMNIPGGINVPGAELAFRVHDLVPGPDTTVVVNCAGRTRSIIGAQSLINAGIPNKVVALRNGTMGWHLAGYKLEHGQMRRYGELTDSGLEAARSHAADVAKRFGVKKIDRAGVDRFRAEAEDRSLYLLDVRDPTEFAVSRVPGSLPAPGGQLVQATDAYVATRNARIVLIDDHGVRATMTASWLIQMGWNDVYVYENALVSEHLETGHFIPPALGFDREPMKSVSPESLQMLIEAESAVVVDVARSLYYRDHGHVPGAWFAVRARLAEALRKMPESAHYVVTSEDGRLAKLAAYDLAALTESKVSVLAGGTDRWRADGLPVEKGMTHLASEPDDVYLRPYDREQGVEEAMNEYLSWEIELVRQIERDGDARFVKF
ncbi:rhodanese-like domain-containing protein [Oceanibaculum indicum]|uniref:Rhodanese-related sulfurtransferase n=1 Tax=Oceanibaculum indicum TaxID=526216 RepID=A0A420WQ31_9PROT|nr:rhodanese-like domain-containing protein [Oceanibaculum indicum]RKQ73148.1 rhodanese-related sulfurtransferase [Oceanibaculum indicum]